ncbi:large conductance mechanosensitive channel protein MscL [Devriesea agamarum]|uniref:large conductance mechanosensitive channel protein MscL n=1 Tax=Devriesea agamarum TaxID=472569 RepID=UPI000A05C9C3|nr:large conductance mechanosensitive channel protein MscL [Devriesea agamarum]
MKGFKNFIMRGNVIDLAVAVVIGGAFTALVTAFVKNLIEPVVNIFGGTNPQGLEFQIISGNAGTTVKLGAIIGAVLTFLITAAVVYFVFVLPMQKARELANKRLGIAEEEDPVADDIALLTEIRDLLQAQQTVRPAPSGTHRADVPGSVNPADKTSQS